MYEFIASQVDVFAYLHGAVLVSVASTIFLLGRAKISDTPWRSLSLVFLVLALRQWTRTIRYNAEVGSLGIWTTTAITVLSVAALTEFLRRSRLYKISLPGVLMILLGAAALIVGPALIDIDFLAYSGRLAVGVLATWTIWIQWQNERTGNDHLSMKWFWLALGFYLLISMMPPFTATITPRVSSETAFHFSIAYITQTLVLCWPLAVAIRVLDRRFREVKLERTLTATLASWLFFWVLASIAFTIGLASFFGSHAGRHFSEMHVDGVKAFETRLSELVNEGRIHLAMLAGTDQTESIAATAERDKLEASRLFANLCPAKESTVCYLLDAKGNTIATSNWDTPVSFLGQNFAFRGYFSDALSKGRGRQIAKGVTSKLPGLYEAQRIRLKNGTNLVLVVKSTLQSIIQGFSEEQSIFLIDKESNILLTNDTDAVNQILFNSRAEQKAYLGEHPANGSRMLYEKKTALFREFPTTFEGIHLVAVQIDHTPSYRLTGFVIGMLLHLSAAAGVLVIVLMLFAAQENADNLEELHRLEKENIETRAKLFHNEKLASLGLLSAGVAHEINNPLAVVMATLHRIKGTLADSGENGWREKTQDLIARGERSSERIAAIVKKLLIFARVDESRGGPTDVRTGLEDTAELVRSIFEKEGIALRIISPDSCLTVDGNLGEINQIILNLMLNARDAVMGRPEPEIRVILEEHESEITLSCIDNGCGIPESLREKMFVPFFTTKPIGKGTGLGLSISHSLAASMGGSLEFKSTEGVGTTFILRLPKSRRQKS